MSKIEVDLQNLSALEVEIKLREGRKISLQSELESLAKELNTQRDETNKEIARLKQQCETECQVKAVEADKLLKEAENKLKTIQQRERDSEIINEQIKQLDEKSKAVAETQREAEGAISLATEREHKANLLIEQYTDRLNEIGGVKEEAEKE